MGAQAIGTILDSAICVGKVTAAVLPQCVQGAIAEQAIEGFRICALMAGKIVTFPILKKIVIRHFSYSLHYGGFVV